MKALFISYNGLLEPILPSQAIPYLKGLAERGYEFILLTYEKKGDLDRVGRKGLRKLKEGLKKYGIDWQYLRYHKNPPVLSTIFDLFMGAIRVFFIIFSGHVKIVHVRGITPGIAVMAVSKFLRFKILFDMRGLLAEEYAAGGLWEEGGLRFRLVKAAEKRMLMRADAVTVLTRKHLDLNRSLDYLVSRNIPMDVVPCCVDTGRFVSDEKDEAAVRSELGIGGRFVLMYPGKIGTFYFMDEMLAFFKYMSVMLPDAVFFIVTADEPSLFLGRAKALGIAADRILIKEKVPYEEMPRYMRMADAGIFFINPRNKIGSSPIKMGEFLSSGVPVIINPGIGDTEELVRDNRVGVVVNSFTEREFGAALGELIELKRGKGLLRERCAATARKLLSNEAAITGYAAIYRILSV